MVDTGRCVVAATLVVALSLAAVPASAGAGAVHGVVYGADGTTPQPGVTVRLAASGGQSVPARPTDAEGRFEIASAEPGSYALLLETSGATWLAEQPVVVASDRPATVAVRLAPAQSGSTGTPATSAKELPSWAEWLIAGGIAVAGTVLILEVTDKDETHASPF